MVIMLYHVNVNISIKIQTIMVLILFLCESWKGLKRCGKSCRLRWTNYLRPDIKRGEFSLQEEETIIQLHRLLGNKLVSLQFFFSSSSVLFTCMIKLRKKWPSFPLLHLLHWTSMSLHFSYNSTSIFYFIQLKDKNISTIPRSNV